MKMNKTQREFIAKFASAGGKAAAANMTKKQLRDRARKAAQAKHKKRMRKLSNALKKGLLSFFLMLLYTGPLQAQSAYPVSRGVLYAGHVVDQISTEVFLARGFKEANPILGQNRTRRLIVSTGATIITDLLTAKLKRMGHPKLATSINFAAGASRIAVGVTWNLKKN